MSVLTDIGIDSDQHRGADTASIRYEEDAQRSGGGRARRGRPRGFQVTERDRELVGFVAAHRFVLACQARALLGADRAVAYRRLDGLTRAGLLSYERIFHAQPGVFRATFGGLALIDSPLPRSKVDLRTYRHDVGAAWVWLAARAGCFGPAARVWSERELRSIHQRDEELRDAAGSFGVRIDGYDRAGRPRVHLPDVLVADHAGRRIAVELELSVKSRRRLELILLGYLTGQSADRAVYVTDSPAVRAALDAMIAQLGVDGRVWVQYLARTGVSAQWWLWPSITDLSEGGT